jgi:hypothetical protein
LHFSLTLSCGASLLLFHTTVTFFGTTTRTGRERIIKQLTMTAATKEDEFDAPPAVATCSPDSTDVEDNMEDQEYARNANDDDDASCHDDAVSCDIPEEFICPLTLEIFTDPLMDKRGMNWERSAILEWLNRGHTTCPLTREPMGFRSLIPNVNLRTRVEHWKRQHGYEVPSQVKKSWDSQVVAYIEAPPGSRLELHYTQTFMQARADAIMRRIERREQARENAEIAAAAAANETENNRRTRGRRRRLTLTTSASTSTGYSPATQQRRLAGLLGEALSIVRRPPLATSED